MPRVLLKNLDFIPSIFSPRAFKICLSDGRVCGLDGISLRLWVLCDGTRTYEEVLNVASKEFLTDVANLEIVLRNLIEANLVMEVEV